MVERVEVKDVRVPEQLQRAMAAEAEAAREARAKVIAAEGEHKASRSLRLAAEVITDSPAALQVIGTYTYIFLKRICYSYDTSKH
jgi:erythrocyte band 7 integral membrane protein